MYSVYLVDDETLVLENMQRSVPWEEHALTVVGKSSNPIHAVDEILSLQPEVVCTDIKMPTLNGIELIRKLKEENLNSEFIIISAYDDFIYAKQMIQLGGFDYLIKPVNTEQYTNLFERLLKKLDKKYPHKDLPETDSCDLNKIIFYLNRNISIKDSLGDISKKFNVSINHICNLFSKYLSTTFSAYQTRIRMEYAAQLLISSGKAVKEIASECGYEDYFYFCRVFRNYYSATPTQHRSKK